MIIGMDLLAMDETIVTLHPDPARQGARIDRDKYELLRTMILDLYFTTVKLDLEERGEFRRVPGIRPQQVELVAGKGEASA